LFCSGNLAREKLDMSVTDIEAARVQDFTPAQNHLEYCYEKQQEADEEYEIFLKAHTRTEIQADPNLTAERDFLKSTSRVITSAYEEHKE